MEEKPDLKNREEEKILTLKSLQEIVFHQSSAVKLLLVLATFYTMYFTSDLLVPIFLAFLTSFLTIPIVNFLREKLHIPSAIGSALIVLLILFIVGYGFYFLSSQAQEWASSGQEIINVLNQRINALTSLFKKPMKVLATIFQDIESSLNLSVNQSISANLFNIVFTNTWTFLMEFFMTLIFLYFLMASKNFFLTRIVKIVLHTKREKEADAIVWQIESEVWLYLFVRTMTNIGVAIIVSAMLWAFNLPNPILWGVMAGILEFIPFIGALISTTVILLISVVSFENIWDILLPPLSFFVFISLEGNLFVPYMLGRSMTMNKVAVVFSIFLFGWIWGVVGSFLAVPLVMTIKIILDNINIDNFMNDFLEE